MRTLRHFSLLAVESDKFLLVFGVRYSDVPSVSSWAGGTSAVWLLLFLLFHCFLFTTLEWFNPPFGARVFVVQTAVCGTKTHLASIKKWYFCCWYYLPIFLDQSSDLSTSWLVDWVKSVVWSVSQFWHELKLTYWPANLLNKATQKSKDIEGREEKLVCQSEKFLSFRQKAYKLLSDYL